MSQLYTTTDLDPGFIPAAWFNRNYIKRVGASGKAVPLVITLERENRLVARYETMVAPGEDPDTLRYVERLAKFMLWARGGWRLTIGGPILIGQYIRRIYSKDGARAFDVEFMTRVYQQPFEVVATDADSAPAENEVAAKIGGYFDGCRIGFDLGASDYKVAAVKDGEAVWSEEFPWNPKVEADPEYHYRHLASGIRHAAARLPRVDAIGGSSAGIIVENKFALASLIRAVPTEKLGAARNIFLRLKEEWNVPLVVVNDGDVTALAGAISLKKNGLLGIAMGSSQAAGYIDPEGGMTGWFNEFAFTPVDYSQDAPADEWSQDTGVGAPYFSQQAVSRLLGPAGIELPHDMPQPERLKIVQELMGKGDESAAKIYQTIGFYLGWTLPLYAEFYDFSDALILGRVTTGRGGEILLDTAHDVLRSQFPDLAERIKIHLPDEKNRRVGQAVAAASLPLLNSK